jgi:hypothetical protein
MPETSEIAVPVETPVPVTHHVESFAEFQNPSAPSIDRLVESLDKAYHHPWLLIWRSFLQGLFYALGAAVGFASIAGAALYFAHINGGISLLNPLIDKVNAMVQTSVQKQTDSQVNSALKSYTDSAFTSVKTSK